MKARSYTVCIVSGEGDPLAALTLPKVAALLALGIPAVERCPFYETVEDGEGDDFRRVHHWFLQESTPCKTYKTPDLVRAWDNEEWLGRNQNHPLALIRSAFHFAGVAVSPRPLNLRRFEQWKDKAFRDKFRDDPRAFVGDAFAVLDLLKVELEKSVPLLIVRKSGRKVLIPIDATPEEEAELLSKLES